MPIFDYQCQKCDTKQEKMVKSSDEQVICPNCQTEMTKQLSSPCFILHGVGVTSNGSFKKAKEGPKLDQELLALPEDEFNRELGLPEDLYK